ncbi:MAG: FAD-dependent oxidoreductase, partial [Pirellulaceae bacterium]|nr:FAD-dependent oxidoreductase [Pirellulaceae bacterium]
MPEPPLSLDRPILILGGGINGAAAARELTLNGFSVVLVDQADLASGATAYSSRLIHGGLRYLEYGELSLVRESLAERTRLLQLAPDFVRPLRLFIPVKNQLGGLWRSATKFLGMRGGGKPEPRGLTLVRTGLWMYDTYAQDKTLPLRSIHKLGEAGVPPVDANAAAWLAAYSDAQIPFPERFVVALLRDAQKAADENGCTLRVMTYHRAWLDDGIIHIAPVTQSIKEPPVLSFQPAAIINATGVWVDETLQRLPVTSRRLMGGSKGSHFFTWHPQLKEMLGGNGIYTEAADGRPVFLLPLAEGTLVGTTDASFSGDPATAMATDEELDYLVAVVRGIFPAAGVARHDIAWHYSGIRPLPYVDAQSTAAITRRHQLVWNESSPIPLLSLIGGKLTTCRSLAEETAAAVLVRLGESAADVRNSRARVIPGGVLE